MMVGHAMLAFALATVAASRRWPAERALAFGVVAAAFATIPDVDMLYALVGVASVGVGGVWEFTNAFWGSSTLVHRSVTHSLVVGAVAAIGFAGVSATRLRSRLAALALLGGLAVVTVLVSGVLAGVMMTLFLAAGVAVALVATSATASRGSTYGNESGGSVSALLDRADFSQVELLAAALLGLLTHPFGDVFTGEPPQFLYPLDAAVLVDGPLLADRVALVADPTLNLVAIFALELATIWLALAVFLRATDRRFPAAVDARATAGVAYAIAAVVLPAPTLDVSYHFVFSVLAVGVVGVAPQLHPARSTLPDDASEATTWLATGLAAVSVATVAYTLVYLASSGASGLV